MVRLTPEDIEFIEQLNTGKPNLVNIANADPHGGHYKLAAREAEAFSRANDDYKAAYGHDIPIVSAYRDPARNKAADGAPNSRHLHGSAIDIDRSALAKVTPILKLHGFQPLGGKWHGRSEDNHFELRGASRPKPNQGAPLPQQNQAARIPNPLQPGSIPTVSPAVQHANQEALRLSTQRARVNLPKVPDLAAIEQQSKEFVQSGAPHGQPPPQQGVNILEGLGNIAGDIGKGVGNAAQGIGGIITNPGKTVADIGGTISNEAQHTQSPLDLLGGLAGGGAQGVADLINGIASLPADVANSYLAEKAFSPALSIPTGDLENYLKDKQASAFIGQLLPFIAAEGLTGGVATGGALAKIAKSAGVGAGFGALNDSHGQGLSGRAEGATNLGALGGVLGAAGEGVGAIGRKLRGTDLTAEVSKPQHGFVDRHGEEITSARQQSAVDVAPKPQDSLNAEQVKGLTESFKDRNQPSQLLDQFGNPIDKGAEVAANQILPQGAKLETLDNGLSIAKSAGKNEKLNLLKGTATPEGRPEFERVYSKEQPVKSAKESAEVFKAAGEDIGTAERLANEAALERQQLHKELVDKTGVQDITEAQKTIGREILDAEGRIDTLTPDELTRLEVNRDLLDKVLTSRKNEVEALKLLEEERKTVKRSELKEPVTTQEPEQNLLRSSKDIAMERAESLGQFTKEDRNLLNFRKPEPKTKNILDFERVDKSSDIIKDINRVEPKGEVLRPGVEKTSSLEITGPSGRPVRSEAFRARGKDSGFSTEVSAPESGGEVFKAGRPEPELQTATKELQDYVVSKNGQLITIAEAENFMRSTKRPGMEHLTSFLKAGRDRQTLDFKYNPLKYGRAAEHSRSITPFALEKRKITPSTEYANLKKQFKGDNSAILDNVVQRLRDRGVNVSAADAKETPSGIKKLITKLDEASNGEELTHIYMHSHNLGETTEATGKSERGYRLDTLTESSLTGKAAEEHLNYTNQIAPAFEQLNKIMSDTKTPEGMKRIVKQMASGGVTKKSVTDLKKLLEDVPQSVLDQICAL